MVGIASFKTGPIEDHFKEADFIEKEKASSPLKSFTGPNIKSVK